MSDTQTRYKWTPDRLLAAGWVYRELMDPDWGRIGVWIRGVQYGNDVVAAEEDGGAYLLVASDDHESHKAAEQPLADFLGEPTQAEKGALPPFTVSACVASKRSTSVEKGAFVAEPPPKGMSDAEMRQMVQRLHQRAADDRAHGEYGYAEAQVYSADVVEAARLLLALRRRGEMPRLGASIEDALNELDRALRGSGRTEREARGLSDDPVRRRTEAERTSRSLPPAAELRGLIHRLRHGPMGQSDAELAADVIEAQLAQRKGGSDARR